MTTIQVWRGEEYEVRAVTGSAATSFTAAPAATR